ncbi:MarR family transcriptional regulator [Pseudofrankia sp. DC12]|uniref:MarR family winged helix-turn-helix transcriptional regulator n=1 Tax=Pseudofrankia sp. DC12 TaxID=683315 RepID=UPI0005F7F168|nr:MarR family transcriptional regulator [Pseudofrankia sp. DC12]
MPNGRAVARGAHTPGPPPRPGATVSEPGWVDEVGLTGHAGLLARLVRLNMLVSAALDGLVEPYGVTVADYLVIGAIRRSPGGRGAPSRLCRVLGRTSGGMTLTLDRLVAAGLVLRAPDPSDRRRVTVELTPAGDALSRRVNDRLHAWESALGLPEPLRAELNGALDTVLEAVAPGADR